MEQISPCTFIPLLIFIIVHTSPDEDSDKAFMKYLK